MRVLVAGIGNIFLGDDAFGVEVVRALAAGGPLAPEGEARAGVPGGRAQGPPLQPDMAAPHEVRLCDLGVRAFDLACAIAEGWDEVLLVDASPRGKAPGTLCVIEAEMPAAPGSAGDAASPVEVAGAHSLDPVAALALARALGGPPPGRVRVVACEPARLAAEDGDIAPGLSPEVEAAVAPAAALVRSLVRELLSSAEVTGASSSEWVGRWT